jgi:GTP cyclohydrolase I
MKDIQNQEDHRRINIKKVGVKTISYPITVLDKAHSRQDTVASVNMYVNLPHHFKGTHMSRFIEILNKFHGEITLASFHQILQEMKTKLEAEQAHIEMEFPYFLHGQHSNGIASEYRCKMNGSYDSTDDLTLEIQVPISPPGIKSSALGLPHSLGHWGNAIICVRFDHFIWLEDLIDIVDGILSHNVTYQTGQSPSEKQILSAEQLTKDLALALKNNQAIRWFQVTVENLAEGFSTFATIASESK